MSKTLFYDSMTPMELRAQMVASFEQHLHGFEHARRYLLSELDSVLFTHAPVLSQSALGETLKELLALIPHEVKDLEARVLALYKEREPAVYSYPWLTALQFQEIAKGLILLALDRATASIDYHWHVAEAARSLGLALPAPMIFADTNWIHDAFAFVVSPGTAQLELWRVDYTGTRGKPMSMWEPWLDGTHKREWGVYTDPAQYGLMGSL